MKSFTEDEWEEYAQANKIIYSSCQNCVFFSSPESCACGRLEKFKEYTPSVVDIVSEEGDKIHKVINGRICNMYRTKDWLRAKKSSLEQAQSIARKEIYIQCTFIILCKEDEDIKNAKDEKEARKKSKKKISKIIDTMKSIDSAEIPPKEVVILNESCIQPYDFINYLRIQCEEDDIKCKWRLEHFSKENFEVTEDESPEDYFLKNVFKTIKTGYCAIFKESEAIPKKYLLSIDKFLNDDLNAFVLLKPDEGTSGMFLNSVLFKQFLNNKSKYTLEEFFDKIEKTLEEQKCKHLIQSLSKALKSQE